jgi:hypothetical protein
MAGPTTKTQWASYIPVLWAQRILEQLRSNIVCARLCAMDYQDEIKNVGDTVRIPKVGALSAVDKVAGTAVTRQNPAASSLDLVLDKHKVVPFVIEDVARAQSNPTAMDAQINEAVRALVEQFETDIIAACIAAAGSNVGTYGTDASEALLLSARKALADSKAPQGMKKHLLWSTKDTNALLTTASGKFSKANESGRTDALYEANLGRLYGFDHFESQLVPALVGPPVQTQNIAAVGAACQVAVRPLPAEDSGAGVKSAVVSDPLSGLSVRIMSQYDINNIGLATNVDLLYGIKVVRPEWVCLVKT